MKDLWQKYKALPSTPRRLIAFTAGLLLLIIVNSAFGGNAYASNPHHTHGTHDQNIDVNVNITHEDNNVDTAGVNDSHSQSSGVRDSDVDLSRAMSAAGDTCVFDYDPGWQGCGGLGFSGDEQAVNLSVVTRHKEVMIRFSAQSDDSLDEMAGGAGVSWHF